MQSRELVKLYYRIGEVSEIVGVQPHVLRYWETEFRSIRPQKSSKGQRVYSRRDVEKLLRVKDLLRNQGFTIAGARKRLSDPADAAPAPAGATPAAPAVAVAPVAGLVPSLFSATGAASAGATSVSALAVLAPPANAAQASPAAAATLEAPAERLVSRSAKDMRRTLLGLRQDLMRMLGELNATRAREDGGR